MIKIEFYFSYLKKDEWGRKHERRLTHVEKNFAEFMKNVKSFLWFALEFYLPDKKILYDYVSLILILICTGKGLHS